MSQQEEKPLELDFSGLKEALIASTKEQVNTIMESMKPKPEPEGKGYVMPTDKASKIVESLHKVKEESWHLTEQWTIVVPNYRQKENRANMRDHVRFFDLLQTQPGDVASIPWVGDVDFELLSTVGAAFAATWAEASLFDVATTVLYEGGGYADLPYNKIERIDQNLLEEINSMLANAAVRSEDKKIMQLVEALTSTNFAGNVTRFTGAAAFYSSNIPAALKLLLNTGKRVMPGECVLYLTGVAYGALLAEVVASQVFAYASPALINQGLIETLIGVSIVVGGFRPSQQRTNQATGTVDLCFLMRGKRAIAIAPKREILIETQKQIQTRKLRIAASHTVAIKIMDAKEIVRIWTSNKAV